MQRPPLLRDPLHPADERDAHDPEERGEERERRVGEMEVRAEGEGRDEEREDERPAAVEDAVERLAEDERDAARRREEHDLERPLPALALDAHAAPPVEALEEAEDRLSED